MQLKVYQKPSTAVNSACAINNGGCHQLCMPISGSTVGQICRCSNGLQLQKMDGSCRPFQSFILFASDKYIRAVPLNEQDQFNQLEALPVLSGNGIGKFDFNYKSRSIIWIEDERIVQLLQINFDWQSVSSGQNKSIDYMSRRVLFELDSATGELLSLTMDWANQLVFYSYTDSPNYYIKVTNFPKCEYHLTVAVSKLDKPSSMAVNPKLKYLYWLDNGQFAKLMRSQLDGSNKTVLIQTEIMSPTDLYVDVSTGYVYWSDNTKDRIERCDWDGKNRIVIKSNDLPNTKSLFVVENLVYYADSKYILFQILSDSSK